MLMSYAKSNVYRNCKVVEWWSVHTLTPWSVCFHFDIVQNPLAPSPFHYISFFQTTCKKDETNYHYLARSVLMNEDVLAVGVSGAQAEDSCISAGELLKASSCTEGGRGQRSSTSRRMATTSACTELGRLDSQISFFVS